MITASPTTMSERTAELPLPDGRTLGYTLHGADSGPTVVVLDGPCSRGLARAASPSAAELGLRLVAPDRPGAFASTPVPGRRITDWPADHAALLDALGVERAGLLGQSGGTPYALAVAAALPERTPAVALLGAIGPMHERAVQRAAGRQIRAGIRLARRAPWLLRFALGRQDPEKAARQAVAALPPVDRRLMEDPRLFGLHEQATREILGQPAAVVEELGVIGRPWGVDFGAVRCPVELWTGAGDPVHPVAHAERVAELLGGRPVHVVPDAASFGLLPRYADALRLASSA
jgi:pimeloyl-ACP methyl ester carboxylesterase